MLPNSPAILHFVVPFDMEVWPLSYALALNMAVFASPIDLQESPFNIVLSAVLNVDNSIYLLQELESHLP